jgi:predicted AlkP superfamily pyrophosphatase or phosphodiesterase
MQKTVVINVVGLTEKVLGEHTPFLTEWISDKVKKYIEPVVPAVTCSVQACYLTGKWPSDHGIVGNGWYFKDECEVKFWKQSNKLVDSEKIWELLKKENKDFTCANLFWWYNMYSSADYSVTPRPLYLADGRKIPDIYTHPAGLRKELQNKLGTFPLFEFWGPATSIRSTKWIANASKMLDEKYNPTLTLIYLPHLDYNFQRLGTEHPAISKDLREVDDVCKDLINFYERKGAEIIILSEYGITNVNRPVHLNRVLRENGLISVKEELGLEVLDPGASIAFAVCDHQLAHIYVKDKDRREEIKEIIKKVEGVDMVWSGKEKEALHINHERAGDIIAMADKDSWFSYYYWFDDKKAPDYAKTVDIHRKPGYDPVELFLNPEIKFPKAKIGMKLIKKKLGFRTLMDVIPLKAELVKGSHGRKPESKADWAIIIASSFTKENEEIKAVDVFEEIKNKVLENKSSKLSKVLYE